MSLRHTRQLRALGAGTSAFVRNLSVLRLAYSVRVRCGNLGYTWPMSRSAIMQARVRPEIKYAAERVLKGLGLTMTDFMELALRRLIVDQRLPFEAVALDDQQLNSIVAAWEARNGADRSIEIEPGKGKKSRQRERRE
jgi:addiction module RelB/DinJ family antitoxin